MRKYLQFNPITARIWYDVTPPPLLLNRRKKSWPDWLSTNITSKLKYVWLLIKSFVQSNIKPTCYARYPPISVMSYFTLRAVYSTLMNRFLVCLAAFEWRHKINCWAMNNVQSAFKAVFIKCLCNCLLKHISSYAGLTMSSDQWRNKLCVWNLTKAVVSSG